MIYSVKIDLLRKFSRHLLHIGDFMLRVVRSGNLKQTIGVTWNASSNRPAMSLTAKATAPCVKLESYPTRVMSPFFS